MKVGKWVDQKANPTARNWGPKMAEEWAALLDLNLARHLADLRAAQKVAPMAVLRAAQMELSWVDLMAGAMVAALAVELVAELAAEMVDRMVAGSVDWRVAWRAAP